MVSYCDTILDHQPRQVGAVDQHHGLGDLAAVLFRLLRERGCRDEDALAGVPAGEGAQERLDLGSSDGSLPPLGLDIDLLQPEPVEIDHTVDTAVAHPTKAETVIGSAAIAK